MFHHIIRFRFEFRSERDQATERVRHGRDVAAVLME